MHTYIAKGLGQWYNMEHRRRQRPAHSDLCNFSVRAGRNLSLSLSHTHTDTHPLQNSLKSLSWLYSPSLPPSLPSSSPLLSSPNPRPIYLISIFFIPSPPSLHSLYQLSTPGRYLRTHSHFVAPHLPLPLSEASPFSLPVALFLFISQPISHKPRPLLLLSRHPRPLPLIFF